MKKHFCVRRSQKAQRKLQEEHNAPDFTSETGECIRCKRQIYKPYYWIQRGIMRQEAKRKNAESVTGITVEKAGRVLITECPHCYMSFIQATEKE